MARPMYSSSFHIGKKIESLGNSGLDMRPQGTWCHAALVSGYHAPGMDTLGPPPEHVAPPPPPPPPQPPSPQETWTPPPLKPGQLAPSWRLVFIGGWVGVIAGFGAIWQAGRIAGIAPWWLGP